MVPMLFALTCGFLVGCIYHFKFNLDLLSWWSYRDSYTLIKLLEFDCWSRFDTKIRLLSDRDLLFAVCYDDSSTHAYDDLGLTHSAQYLIFTCPYSLLVTLNMCDVDKTIRTPSLEMHNWRFVIMDSNVFPPDCNLCCLLSFRKVQ